MAQPILMLPSQVVHLSTFHPIRVVEALVAEVLVVVQVVGGDELPANRHRRFFL